MDSLLRNRVVSVACGLVLLVCYLCTLPTHLPDTDAGEFLAVGYKGGIAHPPGYPVYVLLLRLLSLVSNPDSVVWIFSSLSALLVALAAGIIANTLQQAGFTAAVTVFSTFFVFLTPCIWRIANTVEPFALNLFLTSWLVRWSSAWMQNQSRPSVFYLGLLLGLAPGSHHTLVLALAWPLIALIRRRAELSKKTVAVFCLGLVVGLLPLFYFFIVDKSNGFVWGDWDRPTYFFNHLFRTAYGTFSLSRADQTVPWGSGIYHFATKFVSVPFATACALAVVLIVLRQLRGVAGGASRTPCPAWIFAACLSAFLGGPVFLESLDLEIESLALPVVERFHALAAFLTIPLLALLFRSGWDEICRFRRPVLALTALLAIVHLGIGFKGSDRRHDTYFENHVRSLMSLVQPDSVIVADSDPDAWGLLYATQVLGLGSNVQLFFSGMMGMSWYLRKSLKAAGFRGAAHLSAEQLAETLRAGRPMYFTSVPKTFVAYLQRSVPHGPLLYVGPGAPSAQRAVGIQKDFTDGGWMSVGPRNEWEQFVARSRLQGWKWIEARFSQELSMEDLRLVRGEISRLQ